LRVKPVSKRTNVGFMQVGVETYGGGIWHSWFDRDLSIAGRVLVKEATGNFVQKLVKVDKPILRIPTLAIHLNRAPEFNPNKETELFPIAGTVAAELNRVGKGSSAYARGAPEDDAGDADDADDADNGNYQPLTDISDRHHPYIVEIVAQHAGVETSSVVDFELVLYDTQKSCLGGLHDEFIFSARLDNLNMTFCSIMGLIESVKGSNSLEEEGCIRLIASFDHEEIGSTSANGADGNLLPAVLKRLSVLPVGSHTPSDSSSEPFDSEAGAATAFERSLSTSFLVSADMAHCVHPNFLAKFENSHQPEMNKGTVIKINANQRYATNSPGIVLLQEMARIASVPLQLFVVRNDASCGSTIGPILSAKLGVRTIDLGNPQLSMHSIRETGGSYDVEHAIKLFDSFLSNYGILERKILVDHA
jgi:aspartyl aminopeptidase